eukprot:TRINITY_DN13156_c0_g1_i1.p1 TRINITY_DN13156_c0_g1~~TRINITY_DN13156_c0_g1_i1.p1  ORF type:complete len:499 (+),score=181.00 TRINITY_DN13156_c0_g1_i1:178-1497(+)
MVVSFYLPWCSYSKKWSPEFEKVVSHLSPPFVAGRVDASLHAGLAGEYASNDLMPEVRVFFKGSTASSIRYTGDRTAESLLAFLTRAQRGIVEVGTREAYDEAVRVAKQDTGTVIVTAFLDAANAAERDAYIEAFNSLRGSQIFIAAPGDVAAALGKPAPSVIASKAGVGEAVYGGDLQNVASLVKFAREREFPLFGEMKPGALFEAYAARGLPIGWLFVDSKDTSDAKSVVDTLAPQFADKLSLVWIDAREYSPLMDQLGLGSDAALPAFAIEDGAKHYAFKGKISEASLKVWFNSFLQGKAARALRSEPVPSVAEKKGLWTTVGSTVEAFCTGKSVVLLVYTPWCSHCQAVMAPFKEAAVKFANDPHVKFAVIDASKNDLPDSYDALVEGYPSLMYFPLRDPTPELFTGERSLPSIVKFVAAKLGKQEQYASEADEL